MYIIYPVFILLPLVVIEHLLKIALKNSSNTVDRDLYKNYKNIKLDVPTTSLILIKSILSPYCTKMNHFQWFLLHSYTVNLS